MVQEIRKIILTNEELVYAFECYRRMTPNFLPNGKVVACTSFDDGTVNVTVERNTAKGSERSEHPIRGQEVLKPLIRFCVENNIMLPKNGQKSIAIKDGAASLYIVLNLAIEVADPLAIVPTDQLRTLSPSDIAKLNLATA